MSNRDRRLDSRREELTPPCMGCGDRAVGCHGRCERYETYRQKLEEFKQYQKEHHMNRTITSMQRW